MKMTLTFELDDPFNVMLMLCLYEILSCDIGDETKACIARDWTGTLADEVAEALRTLHKNGLLPPQDMTSTAVLALLGDTNVV